MSETENMLTTDPNMEVIQMEKESAYTFRKRRHPAWTDNYTLYRGIVIPNRLTQRQSVHVPLMKYAVGSIMKEVDTPPEMYFKNLDNNEQKEVYYNAYWHEMALRNKLKIKDTVDKKQALLYGRTFKKLNIEDGEFTFEVIDPQDMLVHRFVDPSNLDTAKVVIQTNIYRTLSSLLENDDYSSEGKKKLKTYFESSIGILEQDDTLNKIEEKNQRLLDLGVEDALDPQLGETYIELNEVYSLEFSADEDEDIYFVYTVATAGGAIVELQKQKLYEVIGPTEDNFWYNHLPYNSWGTDPERMDFWNDGPADVIRGTNHILNSWVSQLLENRTLRNYNMHYYDSTNEQFVPQTFTPEPWGWYPMPGKPSDVMTTVQVADLSESLDEIEFFIGMAEKAVATTSAQSGSVENKAVTLGEVQISLANAQERIKSIALYYTEAWRDFGIKYIKMLEANSGDLKPVTVTREGRLGKKMYTKEITPKMWLSKAGYHVEVLLADEKQESDLNNLQKLKIALDSMPTNVPLKKEYDTSLLKFAGLGMEKISQIMQFQDQNPMMLGAGDPNVGGEQAPAESALPEVPISVGNQPQ